MNGDVALWQGGLIILGVYLLAFVVSAIYTRWEGRK